MGLNSPETLLDKLSRFVGYGSEYAKVIFIGTEEKTNERPEDSYRKRLDIQSKLPRFKDLKELCAELEDARLYNPMNCKPQTTWSPLCDVMLGIDGRENQMGDCDARIEYQNDKLGRIDGDNLLVELLPVPKYCVGGFDDIARRILDIPPNIDIYRERVLPERRKLLADFLMKRFVGGQNSPPCLILGYGKGTWLDFNTIFQKVSEMLKEDGPLQYNEDIHPEIIAGRRWPRFKWAKMKGCLFALTYHPGARNEWAPLKFGTPVAREIVKIYQREFEGAKA
jgi:hypothetical protein